MTPQKRKKKKNKKQNSDIALFAYLLALRLKFWRVQLLWICVSLNCSRHVRPLTWSHKKNFPNSQVIPNINTSHTILEISQYWVNWPTSVARDPLSIISVHFESCNEVACKGLSHRLRLYVTGLFSFKSVCINSCKH